MPIGFFPQLQSLLKNRQSTQGQQMPDPAAYSQANQTPYDNYFARKMNQPGGVSAQPGGATPQQQFNQAQSVMNRGSPGGRMNRRRF